MVDRLPLGIVLDFNLGDWRDVWVIYLGSWGERDLDCPLPFKVTPPKVIVKVGLFNIDPNVCKQQTQFIHYSNIFSCFHRCSLGIDFSSNLIPRELKTHDSCLNPSTRFPVVMKVSPEMKENVSFVVPSCLFRKDELVKKGMLE